MKNLKVGPLVFRIKRIPSDKDTYVNSDKLVIGLTSRVSKQLIREALLDIIVSVILNQIGEYALSKRKIAVRAIATLVSSILSHNKFTGKMKHIWVGGLKYTIRYLKKNGQDDEWGSIVYSDSIINLRSDVHYRQNMLTLFHEATHAIFHMLGMMNKFENEHVVSSFSMLLYDTIERNHLFTGKDQSS